MLAWVGRLVNLPGTVDDIKAWRGILAPLATFLLLLWKSAREWIVNKADHLIALDRALLTIGWLSAALTVLVILAVIWNTYQARTREQLAKDTLRLSRYKTSKKKARDIGIQYYRSLYPWWKRVWMRLRK